MTEHMQGTFNLGEVGEYTPKHVEENDFLNSKLENETYGIYYSVVFDGDAETYLMQAKKEPVVGQPEWGKVEKSKSGKSMRFTRVKKEDGSYSTGKAESFDKPVWKDNSKDITLGLVYKTFVQAEGKLPQNKQEWAVIIANWKMLLSISDGTAYQDDTPLPPAVKEPSLRERFENVKATLADQPPIEAYDEEG